jgi:hypothetical protein
MRVIGDRGWRLDRLCENGAVGEYVEFGDGRNDKSKVLLNVFSVVGVAVVSTVLWIPAWRLVVAYNVGARSEVLSDSFGRFPGDGDIALFPMTAVESGVIMDSGVTTVLREDKRCGGVGIAIVLVEDMFRKMTLNGDNGSRIVVVRASIHDGDSGCIRGFGDCRNPVREVNPLQVIHNASS